MGWIKIDVIYFYENIKDVCECFYFEADTDKYPYVVYLEKTVYKFSKETNVISLNFYTQNDEDEVLNILKSRLSELSIAYSFVVSFDEKLKVYSYSTTIELPNIVFYLVDTVQKENKLGICKFEHSNRETLGLLRRKEFKHFEDTFSFMRENLTVEILPDLYDSEKMFEYDNKLFDIENVSSVSKSDGRILLEITGVAVYGG